MKKLVQVEFDGSDASDIERYSKINLSLRTCVFKTLLIDFLP